MKRAIDGAISGARSFLVAGAAGLGHATPDTAERLRLNGGNRP